MNNNVVPLEFLRPGENENVTYRGTVVASLGVQDVKLYEISFYYARRESIHLFC